MQIDIVKDKGYSVLGISVVISIVPNTMHELLHDLKNVDKNISREEEFTCTGTVYPEKRVLQGEVDR